MNEYPPMSDYERWYQRRCACDEAIRELRKARDYLHASGAKQATDAVRRALKSVEGARRHADGRALRADVMDHQTGARLLG